MSPGRHPCAEHHTEHKPPKATKKDTRLAWYGYYSPLHKKQTEISPFFLFTVEACAGQVNKKYGIGCLLWQLIGLYLLNNVLIIQPFNAVSKKITRNSRKMANSCFCDLFNRPVFICKWLVQKDFSIISASFQNLFVMVVTWKRMYLLDLSLLLHWNQMIVYQFKCHLSYWFRYRFSCF